MGLPIQKWPSILASFAINRTRRSPFIELGRKVDCVEMKESLKRLSLRVTPALDRLDPIDGRQRLIALIERETARLRSLIEKYREPAEVERASKALGEAYTSSDENKQLERTYSNARGRFPAGGAATWESPPDRANGVSGFDGSVRHPLMMA